MTGTEFSDDIDWPGGRNEELRAADRKSAAPILREDGVALLSQQCWCWGRDIMQPQGNWLVRIGFARIEAPADRDDCPSVYQLSLPGNCSIVLRGFGVFFGQAGLGGVFLPRYEFTPRFTSQPRLGCLPWTVEELPRMDLPNAANRNRCTSLLLSLIDWIRQYEVNVVESLGLAYRRQTLADWNDGKREVIPAEQFASAWRQMSFRIADNFDSLLEYEQSRSEV